MKTPSIAPATVGRPKPTGMKSCACAMPCAKLLPKIPASHCYRRRPFSRCHPEPAFCVPSSRTHLLGEGSLLLLILIFLPNLDSHTQTHFRKTTIAPKCGKPSCWH